MEDAPPPNSGLFGGRRDRKRTYEQMSQDSGETSNSTPHIRQSASSSLNRRFPPPPPSPVRYPGDGFDFRRPIMSTMMPTPSSVIDLTEETEPVAARRSASAPRNRHQTIASDRSTRATSHLTAEEPEIIELDDEDWSDVQGEEPGDGQRQRGSSPEVEFLYANQSHDESGPRRQWPSGIPAPVEPSIPWNLFSSGNFRPFRPNISSFARLFRSGNNFSSDLVGAYLPSPRPPQRATSRSQRHSRRPHRTMLETGMPNALNYEQPAFPFPTPLAPVPRVPTYEKPPAPREQFTRAPQEGEVVVCPNCDHELGSGEDELKRQVWVIRSCGHVYCGECAKFRTKRARQRGETSVQPFATCVVDDCKSKTSSQKAMFQLYI